MTINLLDVVTYFIIYSFLGWLIESIYSSIREKRLINRGFLHGPFCPIYGAGALIMFIFLQDFKGNPALIFCLGFVVLSIWEYIVGVLLEKTLNTKYWDYSNYKYNLQGRVCLLNSVFWGLLAVIFINYIHPFVSNLIMNIDRIILMRIDIVVSVIFAVDGIISLVQVVNIDGKLNKVDELGKAIKEKLAEIKNINNESSKSDNTENVLEELKDKQNSLKEKIYKNVIRIKKAFPDIKSDKISKVLNFKIDLKQKGKNKEKSKKEEN